MSERLDRLEKLMEKSIEDTNRLKKLQEQAEEDTKRMKEDTKNLKWSLWKTNREQNRKIDKLFKSIKESRIQTQEMGKKLDWMWLTQWAISEDIVYENFEKMFKNIWEEISSVERNIKIFNKNKVKSEIDVIWVNGTKIFIWETKTKLHEDHIDKFLTEIIPNFKKYDRRHKWLEIFWVIWARVVPESVKKYAKDKGLYIVKEYHNGNARVLKESLKTVKNFT